jgi:RNA polymerase sigma factor (sigma-70 family)
MGGRGGRVLAVARSLLLSLQCYGRQRIEACRPIARCYWLKAFRQKVRPFVPSPETILVESDFNTHLKGMTVRESSSSPVLRFIHTLAVGEHTARLADCQLLQRFLTSRDQVAFAAIVRRHGPMVLRVCRRMLHREHDAEDAFQATFLVLSRRAASVRNHESLASWLYGVAHHVATNLRRTLARRLAHERRAGVTPIPEPLATLAAWEAQEILYDEIARLPERYRAPLVLCCLEGQTRDEAAGQLGWPLSRLKHRLEQAREKLRKRLAARGLTVPVALAASVVCEQVVSAAIPAALLDSTVKASTIVTAGGGAVPVVSAKAAALAEGVLQTMFLSKLKITTVLFLAVAVLIGGAGGLAYRAWGESRVQESQPARGLEPVGAASNPKLDKERPQEGRAAARDQEDLQGTWRVVRSEEDGKRHMIIPAEIKIAGDKILIPTFLGESEYTFKLGTTDTPKRIDLFYATGDVDAGIYQLQANRFIFCVAPSGKERPSKFESKPGSGHRLAVFEREPLSKDKKDKSSEANPESGELEAKVEPPETMPGGPKTMPSGIRNPADTMPGGPKTMPSGIRNPADTMSGAVPPRTMLPGVGRGVQHADEALQWRVEELERRLRELHEKGLRQSDREASDRHDELLKELGERRH